MRSTRIIGLAAATVWVVLAAAGPATADGLARFEKSIKPQIPPDTLTYKSSKALGDNGFVLSDVVITTPPSDPKQKPEPISIKTITVEDLDFDAIEKQQPPLFAKLRLEGVASGSNAAGFDLKQMAGLDKVSADFLLDYKLVPDKKTFTLSKLELDLNGLARLETSMVLDGISPDIANQPNSAMDNASLRTATLVYDDRSLLAKAIPVAAALQGGGDAKSLIAMAVGMLDGMRADQGPAAQKAIDSLVAFVEDYQKPKGPLRIALNPPSKMSGTDLSNAKSADEIVKALGIEVSYAGTRSSKPGEAATAAGGGAVGPGAKNVPGKDDDDDDDKSLDKKK